jgi:hypothetical protein
MIDTTDLETRVAEKACPTFAAWHAATEENATAETDSPEFGAKLDRIERECRGT